MAIADDDARTHDREGQLRMRAHKLLGLELRLLVGVVEALPDIQVAFEEPAGVGARDIRGRDLAVPLEHAELLRPTGELKHPAGSLDVDRSRLLDRQAERHRGGAVDDHRRLLCQPLPARPIKAEPRRRQIARHGGHPIGVAPRAIPEQVREHRVDPAARVLVAAGADDREHRPLGPLQVPGEQLHPDEPGRAGEQHGAIAPGHSPRSLDSERSAQVRRVRVSAGVISSSM